MVEKKNNEISNGIIKAIIRVTKKIAIFGIVIPFIIYISIRFLEIAFGYSWENQLFFQYIAYFYVIGYSTYLTFRAIKNQLYSTFYYSIGWIIGLLLLFRFGLFQWEQFKDGLFIPIVFIILKTIYLLFKKKDKKLYYKKK